MQGRPNIILCTCDQLRAFETGCYGNTVIRTPWIDRLASEGVRFETAVTNYPVCMPARSVLMSGQYNRACTGGKSNVCYPIDGGGTVFPQYPVPGRPHLKDVTLPEILRGAGYHTATIGKWHIHSWPHDVGFDYYLIPRVNHCHVGQSFTENGGIEFVPPGYSVDFEADKLAEFLQARSGDEQPFFMYYNISPPHCPFGDAPEKYLRMYDPSEMPIRANADPDTPMPNQDQAFKIYRWDFRYYSHYLPATMTLPEGYGLRELYAEYYGMTTWVDDTIGRMLRALESTGLAENTIVVFTSDHGDNLGSHGLVQKGGPNEESIRIPLIIRAPGAAVGSVATSHAASLVDLAPTLLSMCGLDRPGHFHGRDLAPLLSGADPGVPEHAFVETGGGAAIRTRDRMCFVRFGEDGRTLSEAPAQYYNLAEDPYEFENLAGSSAASDATALELMATLRDWDAATPWTEEA